MNDIFDKIENTGILPVIKLNDPDKAVPLARALITGGIAAAEITFRTSCAAEAIRRIKEAFPAMLIGAGTVLTTDAADAAIAAGAEFIVSPGLNSQVVGHCLERSAVMIPGISSATELECALSLGLDTVKFFPAEAAGGLKMLKALSAPYGNVRFMPTGGINESNLGEYLAFPKILACGGSFMATDRMIDDGSFEEITKKSREALALVHNFRLKHIGINCNNESEAMTSAALLRTIFGFELRDGDISCFCGDGFELMKQPYLGRLGHICVGCANLKRAVAHLEAHGIEFDYENSFFDENGKLKAAYFKQEIAGFAVHLAKN